MGGVLVMAASHGHRLHPSHSAMDTSHGHRLHPSCGPLHRTLHALEPCLDPMPSQTSQCPCCSVDLRWPLAKALASRLLSFDWNRIMTLIGHLVQMMAWLLPLRPPQLLPFLHPSILHPSLPPARSVPFPLAASAFICSGSLKVSLWPGRPLAEPFVSQACLMLSKMVSQDRASPSCADFACSCVFYMAGCDLQGQNRQSPSVVLYVWAWIWPESEKPPFIC